MTTRLDGALRREIDLDGATYTLTIMPEGFRLVPKGKRKGYEMAWSAFITGDAALAQALNASLGGPRALHDARPDAPAERHKT